MIKFGRSAYGLPRPASVKWAVLILVVFGTYLFTNIDTLPLDSETLKAWLKWLAPPVMGIIVKLGDFFGVENIKEDEKPIE